MINFEDSNPNFIQKPNKRQNNVKSIHKYTNAFVDNIITAAIDENSGDIDKFYIEKFKVSDFLNGFPQIDQVASMYRKNRIQYLNNAKADSKNEEDCTDMGIWLKYNLE